MSNSSVNSNLTIRRGLLSAITAMITFCMQTKKTSVSLEDDKGIVILTHSVATHTDHALLSTN